MYSQGLPRFRLPSRNWSIFLGITGTFFGAVFYDKYQTRRNREKWCKLVSHISEEHLDTKTLPRRVTIYLSAPPGDGLRAAREHFHEYVKPVLVAAALDWDVIEGRKEGDVRHKTAEKMRKRRRVGGEGEPLPEEDYSVELIREKAGTRECEGVAGDLVVGRHTWKEYVRGLHEGWLGPADAPKEVVEALDGSGDAQAEAQHSPSQAGVADAAVTAATNLATTDAASTPQDQRQSELQDDASPTTTAEQAPEPSSPEKKEDPPKPRQPPAYIKPSDYPSATLSALTPSEIGPSTPISFPHILGFRNTPIRIYRFLTRRYLADNIGRQVACAVLGSHRAYDGASEVQSVLEAEEGNWWKKTVYRTREPHEESVLIEDMACDERITGRMRRFELDSVEEDRAKRIGEGKEGAITRFKDEE